MKRYIYLFAVNSLIMGIVLISFSSIAVGSNVCSRGTGEPPFLSYGADSNLLMLIDNSGSMLDTAYVDKDTDGAGPDIATQCFDEGYVPIDLSTTPPTLYGGTFPVYIDDGATPSTKTELWYEWVDIQPLWEHIRYAVGDRVFENGIIYEAVSVTGNASSGSNIYDDTEAEWLPITRPIWVAGTVYHAGSFVYNNDDGHLYHTANGSASASAGTDLLSDSVVADWLVVSTWINGITYSTGDYVLWKDVLYEAKQGGTANGTKPWDDTGVFWVEINPFEWKTATDYTTGDIVTYQSMLFEVLTDHTSSGTTIFETSFSSNWLRLDQGYYQEVPAAIAQSQCTAATAVADNTKHMVSNDLCLSLYQDSAGTKPTRTTYFAATGNFLNWLTASKFDIQKSILTGGKYNPDARRLISENRGCSGSRFFKQITLDSGYFLTLAVNGPRVDGDPFKKDRTDNTDDTTRIEVLAVSATGYNAADCQAAVDKILTHGLNGAQNEIDTCLAGTGSTADARTALNHAMQYCWQTNRNLNTIVMDCVKVYAGLQPGDIANWANAYNCYGIFDENFQHDVDRTGYAGRCWKTGTSATGSTCDPYVVVQAECDWTTGNDPCEWWSGGVGTTLYRNSSSATYREVCTNLHSSGTRCQNSNSWTNYYNDSLTGLQCDPSDPVYSGGTSTAGWSSDIDGNSGFDAADTALLPGTLPFINNTGLTDEAAYCFYEGMEDYCSDLTVPEVIDPTDQETSTSGDYGNIPALLIDSGVMNKLGIDVPMNVMKGSIRRLSHPKGILHETASDLRIGGMAFNSVGADTECQAASTTGLIEAYCPSTNRDGAHIIAPIRLGSQMTVDLDGDGVFDVNEDFDHDGYFDNFYEDTNGNCVLDIGEDLDGDGKLDLGEDINCNGTLDAGEDINLNLALDLNEDVNGDGAFLASDGFHVDDTVRAVNAVRATSWTPLAEAVYNAIGYYTQNTAIRLNNADFQTDIDVTAAWQNTRYYGPGSYLLAGTTLYQTEKGGISSGSNLTNDIGVKWLAVSNFNANGWVNGDIYNPDDIILYDGKFYHTVLGGTAILKSEANGTTQNGPFFDAGMRWDFLIDPVINHCQANYLLIITEGASTADISADVEGFALGSHTFNSIPIVDTDESTADAAVASQCTDGLKGSTYVDDLTYFAQNENDQFILYPSGNDTLPESDFPFSAQDKNTITTFIVTAGAPRDNGNTNECNPAYLMDKAALNGGTNSAMKGENPQQLEDNLLAVFNALRQRASAGSAASVISSARGGEGAIYQAIFWPELARGTTKVQWAGDVHGLFLDENGFMFEDTNSDRKMVTSEDLDGDGKLDCGEDINCNGVLDTGEDIDLDLVLDRSEDLNEDGIFDAGEDIDLDGHFDRYDEDKNNNSTLDGDDKRVIIYFDSILGRSMVCWNSSIFDSLGTSCTDAEEMDQIHFLWSANQWLSDFPTFPVNNTPSVLGVDTNRSAATGAYNANSRQRYIFTWNDLDKDGIVDSGEVVDFARNSNGGPNWGTVTTDFDVTGAMDVEKIIHWIRGNDFDEDINDNNILDPGEDTIFPDGVLDVSRSRLSSFIDQNNTPFDPSDDTTVQTPWRLGDIIHSTPMTVAAPAEGYHLIYNDFSYAQFVARWKNRRHMIYFGANDGMLHAVNGGFYRATPTENKFYYNYNYTTKIYSDSGGSALGTEMWSYVPYNLHPHLKCLMDPLYAHKYFVDQRPRMFDVQIFDEEPACATSKIAEGCIHPNGWGTLLVGGMRFGGAPIAASDLTGFAAPDTRKFISSYFFLDITNPEQPPTLLGELTSTTDPADNIVDLGYSSVIPTMVIMKDAGISEWYLVLGSGPHGPDGLKGISDQEAKISILPLDWLVDTTTAPGRTALQIPSSVPNATNPGGSLLLPNSDGTPSDNSFVSDLITVDFDINPSYQQYKSDAVYFGTVETESDNFGNVGFSTYPDGTTYWNGGGQMYRLVMDPAGHIVGGNELTSVPVDWEIKPLLNLASTTDVSGNIVPQVTGHPIQPITSSASVSTDLYNFWLYFGTGRFFDAKDKSDRQQQSYYGIKEPMEIVDTFGISIKGNTAVNRGKRKLTWDEVELSGIADADPGEKGLAQVDEILVAASTLFPGSPLTCRDNSDIPDGGPAINDYSCMQPLGGMDFYNATENNGFFADLETYIAGTSGNCRINECDKLATCTGSFGDDDYKNNCVDGWQKDFWPYGNREKNVGQATLLGGLVTFTTYQPNSGICQAEGSAYLYGVYYKTGTSWSQNVFGEYGINSYGSVENKLSLGRGLATTPNLHVGKGDDQDGGIKAMIQTSTGEIKEIKQEKPPEDVRTGVSKWRDYQCP